ncbi:MAG: hypothetical protein QOJ64_4572 [Acidobacteriota bacterium]|jgi:hypothetical protein|nr:hypothetical protein [Acidobacteriota bacterium]
MDHSYEELRSVALDILAGREQVTYDPTQYEHFKIGISDVLTGRLSAMRTVNSQLSPHDSELFLELFWDLFRQGIITLGNDDYNRAFPWFRVSSFGKKLLAGGNPYFFHDVSSYEKVITDNIPEIDEVTLTYLKEAMQAFMSGCLLSSSVMLGVATEHSFMKLVEAVDANPTHAPSFASVARERSILPKLNKFKKILDANMGILPSHVKEDLDTNFSGIISMIRNFRNESGHPSGKIISREQCFILLQLFVPCCKKIYQLIDVFK